MIPKLSLVIPVYGTERFLERCLDSVLNQNYQNLEIIIVNDCSPGNAEEIIARYQVQDKRIQSIRHPENKGLFQARLTGAKAATGDYIAFLDSDDYVLFDFYYTLIKKITEEKADIVIGKTVLEAEDGSRWVNHFHDCSLDIGTLEGEAVRKNFFGHQGRCYSWHTIWNKLYSKELWDRAAPYYDAIKTHIIMTEDIAFSSVLFYFARKVVSARSSAYFYCINESASTNSKNMTLQKFKKNVNDIITVFDFVKGFLESQQAQPDIMDDYDEFRKFYARLWQGLVQGDFVGKYKQEALKVIQGLYPGKLEPMEKEDYFYDSLRIRWNDGLEVAKSLIASPEIEYVSFDIFDTLVVRPLYRPSQLFELMDADFRECMCTNASFAKIRTNGEAAARERLGSENPEYQDVTLDEIYETISRNYGLEHPVAETLKNGEIKLELRLCQCREAVKELFELAKALDKKVILVSDMYLKRETIEQLLKKNGYYGYERLYLSSDIRLTKHTGDLFKYVLNDLGIPGKKILHLGDTWLNDFEMPGRLGIQTFFIPKTMEVFENIIQGQTTNRCAALANWAAGGIVRQESHKASLGYGAMTALAANKYFDNPYRTFHEHSDLNADPYFIGYYTLGMHLYGFAKWLLDMGRAMGYKKLYFLARDGYLPMLVYQKLAADDKSAPQAEYLYASRKALMPYMIQSRMDLYDFPTVITNQSPETMKKKLDFCCRPVDEGEYEQILKSSGILFSERFSGRKEYEKFIQVFLREFYSETAHKKAQEVCSRYYACIEKGCAAVDMGYSGRIQGAISEAAGHGVDVFFIHADENQYIKECVRHKFRIYSFYEATPCMSGVIREHMLSSPEPSCIGFAFKDGRAEPVFEAERKALVDRKILDKLHQGALDFVEDFISVFGAERKLLPIKSAEISLPYEGLIRFSSAIDLKIFSGSFFEDEVWGGAERINIAEFVGAQQAEWDKTNGFPERTLVVQGNQSNDLEQAKDVLRKHPVFYKVLKYIYRRLKL